LSSAHFYSFSLHDALPISLDGVMQLERGLGPFVDVAAQKLGEGLRFLLRREELHERGALGIVFHGIEVVGLAGLHENLEADHFKDRKSTRLNSSHVAISYA